MGSPFFHLKYEADRAQHFGVARYLYGASEMVIQGKAHSLVIEHVRGLQEVPGSVSGTSN